MGILIYDSNNSGGSWWLGADDWDALEAAGWTVHWVSKNKYGFGRPSKSYEAPIGEYPRPPNGKTWLGAKACSAAKEFDDPYEGIKEWERLTGESANDVGCSCCGVPHNFEFKDGEKTRYISADFPTKGQLSEY